MKIELIAADLDGTLLDRDGMGIPEVNIRALRSAAERGIKVVLASGRPLCMMESAMEALGCVSYAISSNGAALTDLRGGARLLEREIRPETVRRILGIAQDCPMVREIYVKSQVYMDRASAEIPPVSAFDRLRPLYDHVVDDLCLALGERPAEKVNLDLIPPEWMEMLIAGLGDCAELNLTASMGDGNLEITRFDADKGDALQFLCEKRSIPREAVMAFGDGSNDVGMLRWAGRSYGMESGRETARQAAAHTAPANYLGGVGLMVEAYLNGDE